MPPKEAAPASVETPAAAPAPEAPAAPESMQDAMDRIAAAQGDEPAPEGTDPPKEGKPEPEKAAPAPNADLESFRAMAQKLGFQVEDAAVTNKERAEWRRMRKEHTEAIKKAEADAGSNISELRKVAEAEINYGKELRDARKNRDYNKIAKLLEFDDWNKLQDDVIAATTDPNYQKILELEQWKADQEKAEAERQQKAQREAEHQARVAEQTRYRGELSTKMKSSADKLVQVFHDDPAFINAVYAIQEQNWDGTDQVVTPERAIHMKAKGAQRTLHEELKGIFDRLQAVFGGEVQADEATKAKAAPPKRTPERPKAPAPSAPKVDESRADFLRRMSAALDESAMEERVQARKQRAGVA